MLTRNERCLTSEAEMSEEAVSVGEIEPWRTTRAATMVDVPVIAMLIGRCAPNVTCMSDVATAEACLARSLTIEAVTLEVVVIAPTGMNLRPTSGKETSDVAVIAGAKCRMRAREELTADVAAIEGMNLLVRTIETVMSEFAEIDGENLLMPVIASETLEVAVIDGNGETILTRLTVMSDLA